MGNNIKDTIDRRLANLVCDEEQFGKIMDACDLEDKKGKGRVWSKKKKLTLVFVTVLSVLTLMGAGVYYEYKTYRFSGVADEDTLKYKVDELAKTLEEYSMFKSQEQSTTNGVGIMTDSAELLVDDDNSWRTIHAQFQENGSSATSSPYHVTDLEKVEMILDNSVNPMLSPTYIPSGYSFTGGYINFYISPDMMMLEPLTSHIQDEIITEAYLMPENIIRNVNGISMQYENDKGDKLEFNIELSESDNPGFGASGNATVKTLNEEGFSRSIVIQEPDIETYGHSIVGYFQNPILPIDYVTPAALGIEYRYNTYGFLNIPKESFEKIGIEGAIIPYLGKYEHVLYSVVGESLSEDELLKVIRSVE